MFVVLLLFLFRCVGAKTAVQNLDPFGPEVVVVYGSRADILRRHHYAELILEFIEEGKPMLDFISRFFAVSKRVELRIFRTWAKMRIMGWRRWRQWHCRR